MFNLCYWLPVDQSRDYRSLLHCAMPRLWAVSISGADAHDEKPGWDDYIQPLDRGSFDVAGLLKRLDELGCTGPIGLQCFGIGGDAREHLARSMAAWRKMRQTLRVRNQDPNGIASRYRITVQVAARGCSEKRACPGLLDP